MTAILVDLQTGAKDGSTDAAVVRAILQYQGRAAVAATALTDSSTGAVSGTKTVVDAGHAAVNVAASGSSLAGKATTEAALVTVTDALATLFAKANTAATALDITGVTYSGGGTPGGNTVAAVTKSVTGAATGAQAASWNVSAAAIDQAFYVLAALVNKIATATGAAHAVTPTDQAYVATVPAISTDTGTAASPGVTKVVADAALTVWANNAATVAARINAAIAGAGKPGAVAA